MITQEYPKTLDKQGAEIIQFPHERRRPITLAPKMTLVLDKNLTQSFYLIKEGVVKLVFYTTEGKEVTLSLLGTGDFLWNFNQTQIWAIALEKTQIICLSAEQLQKELQAPTLDSFLKVLNDKYQQMIEFWEISQQPASQQIINSLLLISKFSKPSLNTEIKLPPWTQKELPSLTGLSVWTISKILSQFKEKGIIKGRRNQLIFCHKT